MTLPTSLFIILLLGGLVIALALWRQSNSPQSNLPLVSETGEEMIAPVDAPAIPPDDPNIPEVSIEHFFDKSFDGRDFMVGDVLEQQASYTRFFITYRSGDLSISGIMNLPKGEGSFPVLILNHGYIDPAIYTNGRGLRREQDYLARQGFIVIHPDYRNHAQSSRRDDGEIKNRLGYVEDVINLVYAVHASSLPYFDKENIGMLGHSMGGGIAQTVAVATPNLVKVMVLYAPVSMDYRDSYFKYMANNPERAAQIRELYGEPEQENPIWDALSPETFVERITVPILLFQGTRDTSVPQEWSDETAELLQAKGKNIRYVVYPDEGHEFGPRFGDFMTETSAFFRQHLTQ